MAKECTNFNVKIDSKTYDELKAKVKSRDMNMTAFLRLAIRNFDLLMSVQDGNSESNSDIFANLSERISKLERNAAKIDTDALKELAELHRQGALASSSLNRQSGGRRKFNVEED